MSSSFIADPSAHARFLWRNGDLVPWQSAQIHVTSVGHASVASVFEGLKAYWNPKERQLNCFRLREHMQRLVVSARLARIQCAWTVPQMEDAVLALLRANETRQDTYVRPWLFASGLVRNQMVPAGAETELVIDSWPFVTCSADNSCRACITTWTRVSERLMPPRIKAFSNYSNGRLGMIEAQASGYDCPIFLNELGMVTESAGACIAIVREDSVYTPPLSAGILDSFTRATLLSILPELGVTVCEQDLTRSDLYTADEAFFMGTGWEILPIREIDGMVFPTAPGPTTRRAAAEYFRIVRGETRNHSGWLTPVWNPDMSSIQMVTKNRHADK
jgi:branched-chain amino acid aminotransferase